MFKHPNYFCANAFVISSSTGRVLRTNALFSGRPRPTIGNLFPRNCIFHDFPTGRPPSNKPSIRFLDCLDHIHKAAVFFESTDAPLVPFHAIIYQLTQASVPRKLLIRTPSTHEYINRSRVGNEASFGLRLFFTFLFFLFQGNSPLHVRLLKLRFDILVSAFEQAVKQHDTKRH
jgi:hypothetical protein